MQRRSVRGDDVESTAGGQTEKGTGRRGGLWDKKKERSQRVGEAKSVCFVSDGGGAMIDDAG